MRIRSIVLAAFLATAGLVPAGISHAQPPAVQPGFDVEARVADLRVRLQLDANQTSQVRTILDDAKRQMDALRASVADSARGRGAHHDFRERRRAILFQAEDRIWAILTCPQKDAFRLYVRDQMEERLEQRGGGGGPARARGGRR